MDNDIDLHIGNIENYEQYKNIWKDISKIQITCIEKNEECKHAVGDTFIYENPYKRPDGVCTALLHVLDLYIWRVALGFPSWNENDFQVYQIHCPDKKGTVWEMKKIK
jgi:uncharacterized repeat protein (TIGR04076 family)